MVRQGWASTHAEAAKQPNMTLMTANSSARQGALANIQGG